MQRTLLVQRNASGLYSCCQELYVCWYDAQELNAKLVPEYRAASHRRDVGKVLEDAGRCGFKPQAES
eukprot:1275931-Amphidinium_carterae.1